MNRRIVMPVTRRPSRQRGVVLLFSLIALVIMLIVAVALVRSFQSSLFTAGNIGFKRDLQNQSEAAVDVVLQDFKTGFMSSVANRSLDQPTRNYKAQMINGQSGDGGMDAQGIPNVLNDDTAYAANYTNVVVVDPKYGQSTNIRYVVDRLCNVSGDETAIAATNCRLGDNPVPKGDDKSQLKGAAASINGKAGAAPRSVVYRLSIRVTGPRNTQSFFQSTFTVPT